MELYALHKQAVNGDAPSTLLSSATGPEKAKWQAWRSKNGISQSEAMQLYLQEADRQVRVYGAAPPAPLVQTPQNTPEANGMAAASSSSPPPPPPLSNNNTPRGLAAIPLLCAATSESRSAYLRRLSQTPMESAWWNRQEPLCAAPNSIGSIPETIVIFMARIVEYLSLRSQSREVQSFFWPLHNALLSTWMAVIVLLIITGSVGTILQTLVWGGRRTGRSLSVEWKESVLVLHQSIANMCEAHQALTCRLVGLLLLPLSTIIRLLEYTLSSNSLLTLQCTLLVILVLMTWWYWYLVVPWCMACLLGTAMASGACFALIEFAGV